MPHVVKTEAKRKTKNQRQRLKQRVDEAPEKDPVLEATYKQCCSRDNVRRGLRAQGKLEPIKAEVWPDDVRVACKHEVRVANQGRGLARRLEPEVAHTKAVKLEDAAIKLEDESSDAIQLEDESSESESELTVGAMWQDHLATWESLRKLNESTVMNKLSHSMSKFLR